MKPEGWGVRAIRDSWMLLGGVWSAWLCFRAYVSLPENADSFGTMIAGGFLLFFALVGLVLGGALGAVIGRLVERGLRRFGVGVVGALSVATVVVVIVLGLLVGWLQAGHPGLRA